MTMDHEDKHSSRWIVRNPRTAVFDCRSILNYNREQHLEYQTPIGLKKAIRKQLSGRRRDVIKLMGNCSVNATRRGSKRRLRGENRGKGGNNEDGAWRKFER